MADLTFAQPTRRNLLLPILLTVAIAAAVLFALLRFTPHRTADLTVDRSDVYAAHIVFKSDSIVVGQDAAQDDLYAVVQVQLADHLSLPLFVDDITATLTPAPTDPVGNTPIPASAVEHTDLPNLYTSFPQVKKLADAAGTPLIRETKIDPGHTTQGFVIFHFPVTQATWDNRQDATLTLTLYHQPPLTVTLPRQTSAPAPSPMTSPMTSPTPTKKSPKRK